MNRWLGVSEALGVFNTNDIYVKITNFHVGEILVNSGKLFRREFYSNPHFFHLSTHCLVMFVISHAYKMSVRLLLKLTAGPV